MGASRPGPARPKLALVGKLALSRNGDTLAVEVGGGAASSGDKDSLQNTCLSLVQV